MARNTLSDAYAQIHPHLVVPALVHDGRLYLESMDIVQYLDEAFPDHPLVPRQGPAAAQASALVERGKALHVSVRYVSFHWGLRGLGKLNASEEARLRRLERPDSPEQMTRFYEGFDRNQIEPRVFQEHLAALEAGYADLERLLVSDGRPWLVGPAFSYADILWSLEVLRIAECGYPFAANFPVLSQWYARCAARPGFREGVMQKNRMMSGAFKLKAAFENFIGRGLARASQQPRPGL